MVSAICNATTAAANNPTASMISSAAALSKPLQKAIHPVRAAIVMSMSAAAANRAAIRP